MSFSKPQTHLLIFIFLVLATVVCNAEDWPQFKYDSGHSGNVPQKSIQTLLKLAAAIQMTDSVFTSPVVSEGKVYTIDGSGAVYCVDTNTYAVLWKFQSEGGEVNCNNISSPAVAGKYLHFGTMAGNYYVLDKKSGNVAKKIYCEEPIFTTPVVANDRVYFSTLGSRIYALEPKGKVCWKWDYVTEKLGFKGDRWSGEDWVKFKEGRTDFQDQFCNVRDIIAYDSMIVIPAGGRVLWIEDRGDKPKVWNNYVPCDREREDPATLGISADKEGTVYRQWHRRDNRGEVEILRHRPQNSRVENDHVPGTLTWNNMAGSLSFTSVSVRGDDVYRCRPEENYGLCKHTRTGVECLSGYPSIAAPILLKKNAVYGGLDGTLYVVPLDGSKKGWSFKTAFGKAITAPVAVVNSKIYFGCDDGYLYILSPDGSAKMPTEDLQLHKVRTPLTGKYADAKYNRFTSFADFSNTNNNPQDIKPPFKMKWIRRYKGTVKHFSTCGGSRMYTNTAEGQIFAVEQQNGRLLWRRYWPGVHISFTTPLYYKERLYVPQAGMEKSFLRCLNAATGELIWEAPFSGSPSWNRQMPPIVYKNLVIYLFSTGKYTAKNWLFEHQSTFGFPKDQKPLVRAWDINTGKEVWTADFSEYGAGGDDAGMCLMNGEIYYSCYFGDSAKSKEGSKGLTVAIDPATGKTIWATTKYSVHAGCTVSGEKGRIYLGGYNPVEDRKNYVWCLNAKDGSLVWKSEPVSRAIHVITIGQKFLFTHSQYEHGYLIDKETGEIIKNVTKDYHCTRFNFSEPYLIGANMEIRNMSDETSPPELISAGPQVDVLECVAAFVSNGRIFYTANGGGVQLCMLTGEEAKKQKPAGKRLDIKKK